MAKKYLKIKESFITTALASFPTYILVSEDDDIYISRQTAIGGAWSFDIKKLSDKERNSLRQNIDSELLDENKFEFKKCPFCGSYDIKFATDFKESNNSELYDYEYCVCSNCDSEGPKSVTQIYKNDDKAKHEARFKWNKRS